jgi:hypothetical protein
MMHLARTRKNDFSACGRDVTLENAVQVVDGVDCQDCINSWEYGYLLRKRHPDNE